MFDEWKTGLSIYHIANALSDQILFWAGHISGNELFIALTTQHSFLPRNIAASVHRYIEDGDIGASAWHNRYFIIILCGFLRNSMCQFASRLYVEKKELKIMTRRRTVDLNCVGVVQFVWDDALDVFIIGILIGTFERVRHERHPKSLSLFTGSDWAIVCVWICLCISRRFFLSFFRCCCFVLFNFGYVCFATKRAANSCVQNIYIQKMLLNSLVVRLAHIQGLIYIWICDFFDHTHFRLKPSLTETLNLRFERLVRI